MISDEAVAAAAKIILRGTDEGHHAYKIAYAALEAAAPHMLAGANAALDIAGAALKLEISKGRDAVKLSRTNLEGWHDTPPLTGSDWRAFAESLPASEYATALLSVADAMDATNPYRSQA